MWERAHYDWSQPGHVIITVQPSNAFTSGSFWEYYITTGENGGSQIEFTLHRIGKGLKGHLNVLAIEYGSVLWRYKTNGTNLSSPIVSETIVYTGVNDNHIYALDLEGNLLWKSSLPEVLEVDLQGIEYS